MLNNESDSSLENLGSYNLSWRIYRCTGLNPIYAKPADRQEDICSQTSSCVFHLTETISPVQLESNAAVMTTSLVTIASRHFGRLTACIWRQNQKEIQAATLDSWYTWSLHYAFVNVLILQPHVAYANLQCLQVCSQLHCRFAY